MLLLTGGPALAQTSPQPGVLKLPSTGTLTQAPPSAPVTPPQPAPVAPVQRVAPGAGARSTTKPAAKHKGKPTPVVQAPANAHAQRAQPPTATTPPPEAKVVVPPARPPADVGTVTGLKLPRWAALRADDVNLRVGPGTRFPIDWQYHRRDLPVLILREVEVWRLIEDQDGVKGWVHQATLVGHRSFVVKGGEAVLRASASDAAGAVARLKPGVVGRIRSCEAGAAWCEVQVEDYRGWLRRDEFWGTDPGEAVGN